MRKILGIVIFLLTLLPLIGSGDAFTIKAQNFAFENGEYWLPDVDVTAEHKVVCECCKQSFRDDDAFDAHLRYTTVCADYYGINNNNNSNSNGNIINGYCYFCGQPEDQCTCPGAGCNGSNNGGEHKSTIQMQTLRTLLTGLFMGIASISMAQVTVSTSQLNGTKWIIKGDTSGDFDEYTMSQEIWRRKDGSFSTYPYYLTDTPITSYEYSEFDYSKVGKNTKGRYMVSANDILKITYCASIQSFDKTKGVFVMKLVTKGLIGTGDGICEYEMVK